MGDAGNTGEGIRTITYTIRLEEVGFCSDKEGSQMVTLENGATLAECDLGSERIASQEVNISWECAAPPSGCTYTLGYWKNHPSAWDDGIELDDPFFSSGKKWLEVLKTPPKGNAYYILAHQYIAAQLNILNGASSTTALDGAIVWAEGFFNKYTPEEAGKLKPNDPDRQMATQYASLLDQYNNGYIGPGHCDL